MNWKIGDSVVGVRFRRGLVFFGVRGSSSCCWFVFSVVWVQGCSSLVRVVRHALAFAGVWVVFGLLGSSWGGVVWSRFKVVSVIFGGLWVLGSRLLAVFFSGSFCWFLFFSFVGEKIFLSS